jgi:serine/threonine protein kinase
MQHLLIPREDIIHGDIKPQNVLIFKDHDTFISKITDFGYGHHYTSPTEGYCLPLSKPWEAPGVDGSDKEFSLEQAKLSDIYSYSLLCAWVLYGDQFLNHTNSYDDLIDLALSDGAELKSILMFETLKNSKQLEKVVLNCVSHDVGLESSEIEALKELFQTNLGEQHSDSKGIWECFNLLKQ